MKTVTLVFVVPDEKEDALDVKLMRFLNHHSMKDEYVYHWTFLTSTNQEVDAYEEHVKEQKAFTE